MEKPLTQYTKSGRINIAYQVFGSGKMDMVYIPGWISNIDLMWDCPELVYFLKEMAKVCRVILFDKRGTGLSDRLSDLSSLEERMDDIRAVMDAVGSKKAILFGHSEGGSVSALFSATYPERTVALITFGVFAKRRWSEDYPWAPTDEERQEVYDLIENHWGSDKEMNLASLAPSKQDDKAFMNWLARYFRSGASPSAALALTKMNTLVDVIDILDTIEVPTLLLYRTDDIDVKIEEGHFIAERIKGSKFIEFPGNDHLFWAGDVQAVIDEIVDFVMNDFQSKEYDRVLSTILKIGMHKQQKWAQDSEIFEIFLDAIKSRVNHFGGTLLKGAGKGFTATFSGPSRAVHCALDIQSALNVLDITVVQGIHIGECLKIGRNKLGGATINITQQLIQNADPGDILISNTVFHLLSATGLDFIPYGELLTKEHKKLEIYSVQDSIKIEADNSFLLTEAQNGTILKNHSFLDTVIQSIENHLANDEYTVQMLCAEIGLSERQLQRKLKSITNKSPNQLIRSVRLHKAKELIIQKDKSIKEAAYSTGFGSVSYFTKCFKQEFGDIPSAY